MSVIQEAWRGIFTARDRRPIPEWLKEHVRLSPPITKTGPYDISGSRHFEAVFASLQNDYKREVNVLKPVRGGGSLIGDGFCPWTIVNDPGPYMDVFQTEAIASEHAEARIKKIFESCEPVQRLLPADRHKNRNDEIAFTNGHTWYVRGPSLANLQAKGLRYLRLEEVWMWVQGRMGEAEGRVGDYLKMQTSKILRISQAGPMPGVELETSDWFCAYHNGLIHEWEVACLNCGKYFDPIFSGQRADGSFWGITWDKHLVPNGDWDIDRCLPTIRFECPHCAHPMMDVPRTKGEWNRTGRYRVGGELKGEDSRELVPPVFPNGNPGSAAFSKKDSFHWETVIDFPWDELVKLWLNACNLEKRGELGAKIKFYQKRRAMFMNEERLLKGGLHLRKSSYEINSAWPEERARFLAADRQQEDMFWWTVRAWSPEKSRKLGFGKCYGFAELEKLRDRFKVQPNHVFVDSAFVPKGDQGVYSACLKYGWIAIRGDDKHFFTHKIKKRFVQKSYAPLSWGDPSMGTAQQNRKFAPLIVFSKPQMNEKVQELIDHGRWEEPLESVEPEMEKEYALQMASRVKKTEFNPRSGKTKVFWKESKNDHARDLANAQVLGAVLADLLPDPAEERMTTEEPEENPKLQIPNSKQIPN